MIEANTMETKKEKNSNISLGYYGINRLSIYCGYTLISV